MTGRDVNVLRNAASSLCGEAFYVEADVTDPGAVKQAIVTARERFGPIHVLVNNAGQAASAPFLKTDEKLWRQLISVNVDGAFRCSQAALPDMLAAGWGRIVNVASIAGIVGQPYITAYCASKHALIGLTKALATEVAAKGVTVNAVCPGYTESDMVTEAVSNIVTKTGRTREQALTELVGRNPLKRLIKPEEVANAVAWLCLPGSEAVNGQAIVISGGEV
jgi:NAD(P)-dependent dehydrogenase (short-subunit alcohol dehydrogenase family)